jgi:hypothetical protein
MGRDRYHFAALQEPYIDFLGKTRSNSAWTAVYPTLHGREGGRTRAITLVSTSLPTNSWSQIHISSADVVGVEFRSAVGTIQIINVYNDGDHNDSLKAIRDYMQSPAAR